MNAPQAIPIASPTAIPAGYVYNPHARLPPMPQPFPPPQQMPLQYAYFSANPGQYPPQQIPLQSDTSAPPHMPHHPAAMVNVTVTSPAGYANNDNFAGTVMTQQMPPIQYMAASSMNQLPNPANMPNNGGGQKAMGQWMR